MGAVLLGQSKPEEKKQETSDYTHRAAYMILVDNEGNYVFEPDVNKPVVPERTVNAQELKGSLSEILDNIKAQEAAMIAMSIMKQQAQQAFMASQNQQLVKDLKLS